MAKKPQRQLLFDDWSDRYDMSIADVDSFPFIGYEEVLDTMVLKACIEPGQVVLDVGIGTGKLASRLSLPPEKIWGIDFSEKMLAKAAEVLPGAHLMQADLLEENWPADLQGTFDRIISGYTLHEFPDEVKRSLLLRFSQNYLKKDGLILVGDISFSDRGAYERCHKEFADSWDEEEYYWCAEPLTKALAADGFSVEYIQVSECAGVYVLRTQTA